MLLDRLQRFASRYTGLRKVILCAVPVVLCLLIVAFTGDSDVYQIPGVLLLVWLLAAFTFLSLFDTVPPPPEPDSPRLQRWGVRIRRGGYWFLAVMMAALSLMLVVVTAQLTSAWFRMY